MYGLCVHVYSNLTNNIIVNDFGDLLNEQETRKNRDDSLCNSKAGYTHEGWVLDVVKC